MSELILKPMESEEEIRGKAYVHWKSWQETYPGLVDADYLQRLTLETCEERAFRWTSDTWIAKMDGQVVGFACCGASREQSGAGEIYALYVLEAFQKQSIGWRLLQLCLKELGGCERVFLWTLAGNEKAIRFYERAGFHRDGVEKTLSLGSPVKGVRLVRERETGAESGEDREP